jgi:type IX secretion system PorP/SprF family membrane protein
MKRNIFFFVFLLMGIAATAQQLTTSSLYDLQGTLHNPSTAGIQKHGMIGASFRSMWDGIPGGPQTQTVFGSAFIEKVKLGIGGYIYNDVTGPTKRTGLEMAYAYHIPLENDATFSLGLEARFQQFSYDYAKLQASLGTNDPTIGSDNNRFKADAGFGASYTTKKFQLGASVSQLLQSKLNLYSGSLPTSEEAKLYRHYYFNGYYVWDVDGNTTVTPNFLFIYLPNAPLEFQGGVRVEHHKLFWYGLSLRANQSWMLSAGVRIKQKFMVGYAYDIYRTPLSVYDKGSGSHEVLIRYDFIK